MLFVSDETGTFNVAALGYDPSLWVTVAVPARSVEVIRAQVRSWCKRWDVEELHAVHLDAAQRSEMAGWLSGADFIWKAAGTASDLITREVAEGWQQDQARSLRESFAVSEARGSTDPRYAGRGEELYALASSSRRVPLAAFVQFGIVAGKHFYDIVQAAVRCYGSAEYAADWEVRELLVDGKGPGRHGGPKYMTELLYPILATLEVGLPATIGVSHPLGQLRSGMKVADMFGGDPVFIDDSSSEPLVQVADLIGWVVRRRLTHPEEKPTEEAYRTLLRRCPEVDELRVRMMWRNGHEPASLDRYAALLV